MTKASYGSWKSPISTDLIVAGSIGLSSPHELQNGLCWIESRPQEGGRSVLVKRDQAGNVHDITPAPFNIRTRVHEYGGGSYAVGKQNLYFSNWEDQKIYSVNGKNISPITEEPDNPRALRYADLTLSNDEKWLFCVRETHFENKEAKNELVAVSTEKKSTIILASGRDFYSSPRQNPNNNEVCWLEWDHPNMPWDGTELFTGNFQSKSNLEKKHIDGS